MGTGSAPEAGFEVAVGAFCLEGAADGGGALVDAIGGACKVVVGAGPGAAAGEATALEQASAIIVTALSAPTANDLLGICYLYFTTLCAIGKHYT